MTQRANRFRAPASVAFFAAVVTAVAAPACSGSSATVGKPSGPEGGSPGDATASDVGTTRDSGGNGGQDSSGGGDDGSGGGDQSAMDPVRAVRSGSTHRPAAGARSPRR